MPTDDAMRATLIVSFGKRSRAVPLSPKHRQTLGRDEDNAIPVHGPGVADFHCVLIPCDDTHRLVALEGLDALQVNGRSVREATLRSFDRLRIGGCDAVYLSPTTSPHLLTQILQNPLGQTHRLEPSLSQLRQHLLWALLMLQEVAPGANVTPVLELLFEELLDWTSSDALLLFVRSGPTERRALELRRVHRADPSMNPDDAERALSPLIERALVDGRSISGPCPLPGYAWSCTLPLSRCTSWLERRRSPAVEVEGALIMLQQDSQLVLDAEERELIEALARQVGVLLGNARLYRLATRDALTGLVCRRAAYSALQVELRHAHDLDRTLTCLFLDVDDFKRVNDTHGHAAGDRVLAEVGEALSAGLRAADLAARWGGEEFLVMLPDTSPAQARVVADALRAAVRRVRPAAGAPGVTLSIGIASTQDATTADELVRRADLAMYHAKRAGKDAVVAFCAALEELGKAYASHEVSADDCAGPAWVLECAWFPPLRLGPGAWKIGRSPTNDVVLQHPQVSREHGQLVLGEDGGLFFLDLSSNGSELNGEPVVNPTRLRTGDRLKVGPFVIELYSEEDEPAEPDSTWVKRIRRSQGADRASRSPSGDASRSPSGEHDPSSA